MKDQPSRLASDARHLAGTVISRNRPLKFRLNGQTIAGFTGDTVLSAAMACGYDAAGLRQGRPTALSSRHAPPIFPSSHQHDASKALPMERTPATEGADYVTPGVSTVSKLGVAVSRLRGSRSLGLDLDVPATMQRPWLNGPAETGPASDIIVVGGGVSGLTAATTAAKAGLRVTLIEASQQLGGYARLFGSQDGEESPDQSISRLGTTIAQDQTIIVMLSTQAISVRPGVVRVHSVRTVNGQPTAETLDLHAPHIILATGVVERLPIFAGNRLPGISTTLDAYTLAHQFGVWTGKTALFATVTNPAYRLGMLAADAGVKVSRIMDGRVDPQSRFIEFSKAYGITMAAATIPGQARLIAKDRQISLTPQSSLHHSAQPAAPLAADRLVVSGGWQPDLTLWHMAGGESRWNKLANRLEPAPGGPSGMALTGSAAGYFSNHACLASGRDAVAQVLGRRRVVVEERLIDPIYESPDAATPIALTGAEDAPPAFLDGGLSYIERPETSRRQTVRWLPFARSQAPWSLADTPQPLAIADIAAGTQLGAIPAQSAGIVAQERVALIPISTEASPSIAPAKTHEMVPRYLAGRFGLESVILSIAPLEQRRLEVGALIYSNPDERDPFKAIGVILGADENGTTALFSGSSLSLKSAFVREDYRSIPVSILGPYGSQSDLHPPLGSSTGSP